MSWSCGQRRRHSRRLHDLGVLERGAERRIGQETISLDYNFEALSGVTIEAPKT